METRILLLRHAETAAPDQFHGAESDVGLGERGLRQAAFIAPILAAFRPDAVYCSGMRRARETAKPIAAASGLIPEVVEALHERRIGSQSGRSRAEVLPTYEETKARWMAGDLHFAHEGSETYAEIRDRVVPVFLDLIGRWPGRTIVVVAHGVVIRVLLTSLVDGLRPEDLDRVAINFVAINDLRWNGHRLTAASLDARPEGLP